MNFNQLKFYINYTSTKYTSTNKRRLSCHLCTSRKHCNQTCIHPHWSETTLCRNREGLQLLLTLNDYFSVSVVKIFPIFYLKYAQHRKKEKKIHKIFTNVKCRCLCQLNGTVIGGHTKNYGLQTHVNYVTVPITSQLYWLSGLRLTLYTTYHKQQYMYNIQHFLRRKTDNKTSTKQGGAIYAQR